MLSHSFRKGILFLSLMSGAMMMATSTFAESFEPKRLPSGKPDFSCVSQASGRDTDAIAPPAALAALSFCDGPFVPAPAIEVAALVAVGAVPASPGILVGRK